MQMKNLTLKNNISNTADGHSDGLSPPPFTRNESKLQSSTSAGTSKHFSLKRLDQFDWFVFETRIRKFVKEEYMQPMLDKQKDYSLKFDELQKLCEINKNSNDDHD